MVTNQKEKLFSIWYFGHCRLLQTRRSSSVPQLKHKEPPQSFLDTDSSEIEENDLRLPPEVLYMLRSTR